MKAKVAGFSFVELLVVVAVIGILAMMAYPSYKTHIVRTSREAAQAQLQQLANLEEKIFLTSSSYTAVTGGNSETNVTTAYNGQKTGGLGLATGKTVDGNYTIRLTTLTGTTFTLTASPISGTNQVGDGDITIDHTGKRLWNKGGSGTLVPW
jgi:type IV pilus assembly protein PilE